MTEIRSVARSHTRTAINVLVGVMRSDDATPAARVSSANAILDRGWVLLIFDKIFGLGMTDPLAGFAVIMANLVVCFYFAKRGFENVARIIKR
nr:hypothetical protein [Bradyrhizobium liaoningense]